MSRYYSDPVRDFEYHDAHQQAELDRLPKCEHCDEPIQNETLVDFDGTLYHCDYFNDNFVKYTENYIE